MTSWTASINIFDNGETARVSVRIWRVGESFHNFRRPQHHLTITMRSPGSQPPTTWLRGILRELILELPREDGVGN